MSLTIRLLSTVIHQERMREEKKKTKRWMGKLWLENTQIKN